MNNILTVSYYGVNRKTHAYDEIVSKCANQENGPKIFGIAIEIREDYPGNAIGLELGGVLVGGIVRIGEKKR